ncbi:MAG: LysM peptidoglycan-binding domain-containing protein [Oligoflexia bacterium]|nr:LysM peptidoglycan-binding domain-containing protein [Oligoflexia bacterium]
MILYLFSAQAQLNETDQMYEERLARINQNFNLSEIPDQQWQGIVGEKVSESYQLQSGDTLWDISEKLFGNGFYWPKIWQLNDTITNPHNVQTGSSLRFSAGTLTSPPQLEVAEETGADTEVETEEITFKDETSEQMITSEVVIPKGRSAIEPLQTIPDSFPEWRESMLTYETDTKATIEPAPLQAYIDEVIADNNWKSNGVIFEIDGQGRKVASTYQQLYVKLESGGAVGEYYTVFKNGTDIKDPDTNNKVGKQIVLKGLLLIKKPVENENNIFMAQVSKTLNPIEIGDEIVLGNLLVTTDFEETAETSSVSAKIVDGDKTKRKVFRLHDLIYLDKGEKDGLQAGAMLDIVKTTNLKFSQDVIGKAKVVNLGQNVATAIIVKSKDAIRTGDKTSLVRESGEPEAFENETMPDVEIPSEESVEEL